ncbi:MAG: PQQ-binding-like beta-propeller repeat protein [Planctomycetes bacterium]|nr:PQQ-binding-like beta-propeller repeat protein [Planctomycetota bacterium]
MSEGRRSNLKPSEIRDAIEFARRGGLLAAEAAEEALRWLQGLGEAAVTLEEASARLGRPAEQVGALIELARVLPEGASPEAIAETLRLRTSAAAALVSELLDQGADRPTPVADIPTVRAGTPEAGASPTVEPGRRAARANVPPRLGPYQLGSELGHGGMGIVFRAQHVKLGSDCAVKVLIAGEHASPESIERFRREAAAVAKMGKHPNIVTVHDLGQEGALSYYAMELVEGESLRKRLVERPYAPKEAAALVEKVARALHFAHEHGVVHRDVKPENIVVRSDGEPQVMDFGLARDLGSSARLSVTGQVMGTPAYMAPEQVRGDVAVTDARTDVYALGAVLYELLTGIPPHGGQDLGAIFSRVLAGDIVPPRKLRAEVPRDIETICLKCLEPTPGKRYASAEALAEDLARFQRGEPVHARPVGRGERLVRRIKRHPLVSSLISAVAVLLLTFAWNLGLVAPARISVKTNPPDAKLEAVGTTLWGGEWVWPARPFKLLMIAPGGRPVTREVEAKPGRRIDLGVITLCGYLSVETEPPGAEVWLGAVRCVGKAPLLREAIGNGDHVLKFRLPDHVEETRFITIAPGETLALGTMKLAHDQGTLSLTGNPAGMSASVRREAPDAARGHEHEGPEVMRLSPPATVELDTGTYWLVSQLESHFERRRKVTLGAGKVARENLSVHSQLHWSYETGAEVCSSPALGDLNGDGCLDCVVGSGDKTVYALSGRDGAVLWAYETGREVDSSPALGDLNRDGVLDCVVGSEDHGVYALSGRDGAVIWKHETGGGVLSSPALGDLNGDGVLDCVVGSCDKKLYALSGRDGAVLWRLETGAGVLSSPALGDLNGDGVLDCVVGSCDRKLYALSGPDGAALWSFGTGEEVWSSPALGDLNQDAVMDCVVGSLDKVVYALSGRDGSVLWSHETGGEVRSSPALGDFNEDGVPDCVVGSNDNTVYALSGRDGSVIWTYETPGWVAPTTPLGDLNRDGVLDCVVGSWDGKVYALSGRDGSLLWAHGTGHLVTMPPALGDVDGDGILDCVVGSQDRTVYALSGWDGTLLWSYETGGRVTGSPALGELNADRVPDFVVGSWDKCVRALSGRDGVVLWCQELGGLVASSASLGDLNSDGVLDCIVGSNDKMVHALSGRDGAFLWSYETGNCVDSSPALGYLNGDDVLDCLVGSIDGTVYALSGRDGALLWRYDTGGQVDSSPALGELNEDSVVDCVVGSMDGTVYALSGQDGAVLWSFETAGWVYSSPGLRDLNCDGAQDCVVGSQDNKVYALSGRDGALLWSYETGDNVDSSPALGDLNVDGVVDCVVGSDDKMVYALSGRDGAVLWSYETGGSVVSSPTLGDVDGDRVLDCAVGSLDGRVYALSGRDGAVLWTYQTGAPVRSSPAMEDVNGDGLLDCVVGSNDGGVYVILGQRLHPLAGEAAPGETSQAALTRFGRLRSDRRWPTLADVTHERTQTATDAWVRAVSALHLGLARERLGDPKAALDAFAEARALNLRAPDGAVFEWLAAWRWAECTTVRRDEARKVLLDALGFQPHTVFDAFVEARDLLTPEALADLRTLLEDAPADADAQLARAMLLAAFAREGAAADLFAAAERRVLARLQAAEGSAARWHGYLALLADAQGDRDRFRRAYAVYLDQPRRPESLDTLLSEVAGRK